MVSIILVNWNGWKDTIECLESVLRLNYPEFRVIVCDNASADDSLQKIACWAKGELPAKCRNPRLKHLTNSPVTKPVPYIRVAPGEAVNLSGRSEQLILLQTGANLGFAGGNNAGLRLAMTDAEMEFAWLLNNDTVVEADALAHLVRRMEDKPEAGICGSTLLYYDAPDTVQVLGGSTYNRWLARIGLTGRGINAKDLPPAGDVESRIRYVSGASMLLRRKMLENVGLLDEQYFLYFEEIDLATRARAKYTLAYARESRVYHKEGAAIGTSTLRGRRPSALAQRYSSRNRIVFTRTYYPASLGLVLLSTLVSAFARLLEGHVEEFRESLRGVMSGLLARRSSTRQRTVRASI